MFGTAHHLRVLSGLHTLDDVAARRADFRKGLAALAARQRGADDAPLEGLAPELLAESTRAALNARLFDDLGFLEAPSAASALYALATALPLGPERRELGRRVLTSMHEGHAGTFVQVARLVALGAAKAVMGPHARARIALVHALPFGAEVEPDALATTLLARRELLLHYVVDASRGALWDRVLAARIVERAARDGLKRGAVRHAELKAVLESDELRLALERLVGDREPLVWRRAASARGMLSVFASPYADDVERDLTSEGSISRMRRGAASLAATLPSAGSSALSRAKHMLTGPLAQRDPGLGTAFLHGTAAVCALSPELSEALHALCVEHGGREAAEALSVLSHELCRGQISARVRSAARVLLQRAHGKRSDDEGHNVHLDLICEELGDTAGAGHESLLGLRARALDAFVREGARAASDLARAALALSDTLVSELELCAERVDAASQRREYRLLHALDTAWLESSTFSDLLALSAHHGDAETDSQKNAALLARLSRALLKRESVPHTGGEHVAHISLRMRRLRALLHAVDTDILHHGEKTHALRAQRVEKTALLLRRIERDESSALDRIVHASLARGLESLVRDEALEPADVLCAVARHVPTAHGVLALADASMLPEPRAILRALARLMRVLELGTSARLQADLLEALSALVGFLPAEGAPRTESVRACLGKLHDALAIITRLSSLSQVVANDAPWRLLADALDELGRLSQGVAFRLGLSASALPSTSGLHVRTLTAAVERAVDQGTREGLEGGWQTLADAMRAELPKPFAELVAHGLRGLPTLPIRAQPGAASEPALRTEAYPLPAWLPASRFMGEFHVCRACGPAPGVFDFEVVRARERLDPHAPRYILTVPSYDGHVARALSEREYVHAFKREAEALLGLPSHTHLARVIAADVVSHPLPHFVRERVDGPTLARLLARSQLTTERAFALLAGVLRGLHAMHAVGVGHLGLYPAHVIVRPSEIDVHGVPVLSGFGLSGRQMRLGCAFAPYGAPELWQAAGDVDLWQPAHADVYAFGCLAYELLTGERLFGGASDAASIAAQLGHDGTPPRVAMLSQLAATHPLAEWLTTCLRKRPEERASVDELMATLPSLRPLTRLPWPLASVSPAPG